MTHLKRLTTLAEVTNTAAFLVSDLASAMTGTVVNLSGGGVAMGGYSASKAAAYSITQALRPELKKKAIHVLAALPGPTDTDMVKNLDLPKTSATATAQQLISGIARGEEEIFPDPMAQQMGALWRHDPKAYERAFANF